MLASYDAGQLGPLLGVSDDGTAAAEVLQGARAAGRADAIGDHKDALGVIYDAERLNSTGESPVGPREYELIRERVGGNLLLSTNVGSHVSPWFHRPAPMVDLSSPVAAESTLRVALKSLAAAGRSRRVDVNLGPADARGSERLAGAVADLEAAGSSLQDIGILVAVSSEFDPELERAVGVCMQSGIGRIVLDGAQRYGGAHHLPFSGLLGVVDEEGLRTLERHTPRLRVEPREQLDFDAVSRQVALAVVAVQERGFDLVKFGLVPLCLEDAAEVIARVKDLVDLRRLAPALYLDVANIEGARLLKPMEALRRWLETLGTLEIPLTLIDTAEKFRRLRLLAPADEGILTWDDFAEAEEISRAAGVRVLWAGGLTLDDAYELGRRRAFGFYLTSAAAEERPLTDLYAADPGLSTEKHPTATGVELVRNLADAGFLERALDSSARPAVARAAAEAISDSERGEAAARLTVAVTGSWRELR